MKTPFVIKHLKGIESASNDSNIAMILLGLHALLFAPTTTSKDSKVTIIESMNYMLVICQNREQLDTQLSALNSSSPKIIGFGNYERLENDFLIVAGNNRIKYKFDNLLSALDALLKIYCVLKYEIPRPNFNVYDFMLSQYVCLGTKKKRSSKVTELLNMLAKM